MKVDQLCDIEDLISSEEPRFPGLDDVFELMNVQKIRYLEKWLECIFLEEREENQRENSEAAKRFHFQNQGQSA
jgi:hypothetical protein